MLLVVVVLMFTIAIGYRALDAHLAVEEEVAAAGAISEISLKAKMVGMGGIGTREVVAFEVKGGSKLTLRNEDFNGSINGVVDVELGTRGRLLRVLPLPLWDSRSSPTRGPDFMKVKKAFLSGSHSITLTHFAFETRSDFNGTGYLLVG